jgi:ribosome-binding protein aMBF1 (putative translation factor)
MITCDLCGEAKDCSQKEIESKEYDICSECWKPLEQKLRGKGRAKKEMVLLPPSRERTEREDEDKSAPGEPPKIWGAIDQPN